MMTGYLETYRRSLADPEAFWAEAPAGERASAGIEISEALTRAGYPQK
jgi:hypothetical protein